jgi:hypothetical protein
VSSRTHALKDSEFIDYASDGKKMLAMLLSIEQRYASQVEGTRPTCWDDLLISSERLLFADLLPTRILRYWNAR